MTLNEATEKSQTKVRCPECLNFMLVKIAKAGNFAGRCTFCKSTVYSKQHSNRERHIRIVRPV